MATVGRFFGRVAMIGLLAVGVWLFLDIHWPDHLTVATIDVSSKPKTLAVWRVSRAPALVFQSNGQRLYAMEGFWPKERLAKKIEALIHGLVEAEKNGRPEVKGLERR